MTKHPIQDQLALSGEAAQTHYTSTEDHNLIDVGQVLTIRNFSVSREGSPELNVLAAEQTHAWEDKREGK